MKVSILFSLLISILVIVFAFQNNNTVEISFFKLEFSGSLALIIITSILVGFIIGFILFVPGAISSAWRLKKQESEINSLNKKLEEESVITFDSGDPGVEEKI